MIWLKNAILYTRNSLTEWHSALVNDFDDAVLMHVLVNGAVIQLETLPTDAGGKLPAGYAVQCEYRHVSDRSGRGAISTMRLLVRISWLCSLA
jgi:hypothetical protein